MILELKYNSEHETLDLVGRIPAGTKYKVAKVMTPNPDLHCYQGAVDKQVLQLAKNLDANISPDVINAIKKKESLALLKKRDKEFKSNHRTETTSTDDFTASTYGATAKERDEDKMIGYIVKHPGHGYGRIKEIKNLEVDVSFFDPPSVLKLDIKDIHKYHAHGLLLVGTPCKAGKKNCIIKRKERGMGQDPHIYEVEYKNGMVDKLPETEVTPIKREKPPDPMKAMVTQQQEGYPLFVAREKLAKVHNELTHRGVGVKSLLSSRIDLYPHQAYVAGTVILDNKQRYLLTDEVGLGKTIEAGIIIHDLLARNPLANILIICPGMLVQQWFGELYSKFSGVKFRLPELSGADSLTKKNTQKVILPFHAAVSAYKDKLIGHEWDLVVVDEVHRLLQVRSWYNLVKKLSSQDRGLLLLSALPTQHRGKEYYRLLALLEPGQYKEDNSAKHEDFDKLLERQRDIGRKLGFIKRHLQDYQGGESNIAEIIISKFSEFIEMPVLQKDKYLKASINELDSDSDAFVDKTHSILYHISDCYRINRRILHNRREKLIETEQLERIQRKQNVQFYEPDQWERDALSLLKRLLQSMQAKLPEKEKEKILLPLTSHLFQASTHPETLLETIRFAEEDLSTVPLAKEYEKFYDLVSYSEWDDQMKYFWSRAKKYIDCELFQRLKHSAEVWEQHYDTENGRLQKLISLLEEKHSARPKDKFILFAGYPKLASILYKQLCNLLGEKFIARFYYGLHTDPIKEREKKEKEVRKFRIPKNKVWLLISDETGGEGRNFQFVSELIHYDLPFQIAKIEQRIGRLDRLGRDRKEVISNLLIAKGSEEEARFGCLSTNGLGIFNQSISGLEFALKDIEMRIIQNYLIDDDQVLWDMPKEIEKRVKKERALDESQGLMDDASYERTRAKKFRRVQSNPEQDLRLEKAFKRYFGVISENRGYSNWKHPDYPEGVIMFYPENVSYIEKLDLTGNKSERKGTFRRGIAQDRPDLEFFSVGNDFFDSVCRKLFTDPTGRTYAVECKVEKPKWMGFEFSYRIKPSSKLAYQNFLDHLFALRVEHCFVNKDKEVTEQTKEFLNLRRSFVKENKIEIWNNLTKEKAVELSDRYPDWEALLRSTEKTAKAHIRKQYSKILKPIIEKEVQLLDEEIGRLRTAKPVGFKDQINSKKKLKKALEGTTTTPVWELELDTVGFLSINGGILNA